MTRVELPPFGGLRADLRHTQGIMDQQVIVLNKLELAIPSFGFQIISSNLTQKSL